MRINCSGTNFEAIISNFLKAFWKCLKIFGLMKLFFVKTAFWMYKAVQALLPKATKTLISLVYGRPHNNTDFKKIDQLKLCIPFNNLIWKLSSAASMFFEFYKSSALEVKEK